VRRMCTGEYTSDQDYARLWHDCLERRAIKDTRTVVDLMLQVGRAPAPKLATELVAMIARAGHTDRAGDRGRAPDPAQEWAVVGAHPALLRRRLIVSDAGAAPYANHWAGRRGPP
jgi:hypothetical protein